MDENAPQGNLPFEMLQPLLCEILKIAPTPVFLVDAKGNFVFANQAACMLLQQAESILLQKNFSELIRPANERDPQGDATDLLHRAALGPREAELRLLAGNILRVVLNCKPFQEPTGTLCHVCSVVVASTQGRVDHVAQRLFQNLTMEIEFKNASIQLIVERKRILVGAYGFEKASSKPWLLRPVDSDPIIKEIVHKQTTKVLPDTNDAADWEKQAETSDVNSWIGMPLINNGETIGIVTLDHDQPGFYAKLSPLRLARVEEMVGHAAMDIQEAYVLEAAKHQIKGLEVIRLVAEKVATKLDTKELLPAITSCVSEGLACQRCDIVFFERQDGHAFVECKAQWPEAKSPIAPFRLSSNPLPGQPQAPLQHLLQQERPLLIEDLQQDSRFDASHSFCQNARSMIIVPLKIAEQTIGAISAIHEKPGWFSGADQLLLETITRQAGIAIERDIGLELVHSIGKDILRATKVDDVLHRIVSGAMKLTHTDSGVIYLLSEDSTRVIQGLQAEGSVHPRPRLGKLGGITRTVVSTKRMVLIPDIENDPRVNPKLLGKYRSMFAVPLLLNNAVVGVLYLNGKSPRELTETECSLLLTLADQAALAIQRTRLHQQIAESELMYHSLVDHIPQCVFRKDLKSRFTSANDSFCKSLERKWGGIKGKSDFDFYARDKAKRYQRDDAKVMRTGEPIIKDEEHQVLGAEKSIWVRVVKTPVRDTTGRITGVQAIFWDVTAEKQMTERWRSLVEQSPDSIVVHKEGKITIANSAAARLFGVKSPAWLKKRPIRDFIDESCLSFAEQRLERLSKKQQVDVVAMKVRQKSGGTVDVEVYARPGPDKEEIQVVFHDLTRTNTLLREMHHRVIKCLTKVNTFFKLPDEFAGDRRVQDVFRSIRERIQAIAHVHRILKQTQEESEVDMDGYLHKLIDALSDAYDASRQKITINVAATGVELDDERASACGLIVTELVANSLLHAFRGQAGEVSVSLTTSKKTYSLVVGDTGCGMRKCKRKKGESMGLSLVRTLVKGQLKGRMTLTESAQGGTCFRIRFPHEGRFGGYGR